MGNPEFVHLHNHSEYSLLDGMLKITDGSGHPSRFLKDLSAKGVKAMAITDHGNMYGAMEFYFNAAKAGIKPIIGCEIYMAEGDRREKSRESPGHMTLLAADNEGYANLMKIVSDAFINGFYYRPRTDYSFLSEHSGGIIALSGCLKSHLSQACLAGDMKRAEEIAGKLSGIFGRGNFYLELMDHGMEEEKAIMKNMLKLASRTRLPVVATNDCHYEKAADYEAHDYHICIGTKSELTDSGRFKMSTDQLYFKSPEEMAALFSHVPEALKNTVEIAEKCNLKVETGRFYLPKFSFPREYRSDNEYLKNLCLSGLKEKMGGSIPREYLERLEYELGVIKRMGFSSYFLIVMDFISHARREGYMVGPGRGSGAGSLVSYSLDITRIDPLREGLLFERFLNPDRNTMPDLDIDFEVKGRDKVIDYVRKKYGEENVASIITYGTIKAKSAVKDVARVMGMEAKEAEKLTKKFPNNVSLSAIIESDKEIKSLAESDPEKRKLFEISRKIEGLKRHTGVHAAGVVITNEPVVNYVPLSTQNTQKIITTQYDGNMVSNLGLLKVDFLGLKTLDVISGAVKLIRRKDGDFDIYKIPMDDRKTYKLLGGGRTVGIFQLESGGMRELLKALVPEEFSDISALLALYRPGPLKSGMVDEFVARKRGRKKISYRHKILEPILKETYGTIVYQEQVMAIAKAMGGFTPGEADYLRKAMSKKNEETILAYREKFVRGAKENGVPPKVAEGIYDNIVEFAGYGFNKSHSTAYALVSYQTAYLKANYPVEYMASLLTSEIGKNAIVEDRENKIVEYIEDAESMGIKVLPPDVNRSFPYFSVDETDGKPFIRFALNAVKNVGDAVVEDIVGEREKNGLFSSLQDFISRMGRVSKINKRVLESLAKAGAFDSMAPSGRKKEFFRAKFLADIDKKAESGKRAGDNPAQQALFSPDSIEALISAEDNVKPLSEHDLLNFEKEVLGMYVSGHPLKKFRRHMTMISRYRAGMLKEGRIPSGTEIKIAGIISGHKKYKTKKGGNMLKFSLEDLTGEVPVCLFPRKYNKYSGLVRNNRIVVVRGKVNESEFNGRKDFEIYADEIVELNDAFEKWGRKLVLFFHEGVLLDDERLKAVKRILRENAGSAPLEIRVRTKNGGEYSVETEERVRVSCELTEKIEKILGEKTWRIGNGS